mgnify:CR=1 FL=1
MVLEGENAVLKNREIMGATDPLKAEEGTLRKLYGLSIDKNSVHGSDSVENAKIEIDLMLGSFLSLINDHITQGIYEAVITWLPCP